ncbi:putative transcription factor WD40-like family [Helianthus annuus]|uniref:Transcription factor WD40-like family n=1 Tax=Helianthus annuus TaxID=4232 RepID=A0A9K3DK23_HELAN|nr:U4/U6 small nuclear ribonucleoprotein PRP4-like protein [Helianthus annuus]KAF5756766.1 putative transcription factor WD40-like family [Helianthus annuus]KAJ0430220.1 putative transcription factor WD40-like family [Helianthus annuus]KAJ0448646.1 putative transcription factor WD40-like family [Helianthus annuus]KAJ0633524.1 putative transcription factor WD40-like family [Helianthus annuus]KAJ0637337.1 putative transcription factor WD40-like family [Helianthus annuus]
MEIDEKENPNPNPNSNSTTPPPAQIAPIEPPIPLIPPPIAPIPRPLAPIPSVRPPNGETAKKTTEDAASDEDGDDSGPEYEVSEESRLFREKKEKAKQDFLMKQRAAALAVPTNDKAVRSRLRRLGEPVTLFGEREMERRDRLRMIMAKLDSEGRLDTLMKVLEEEEAAVNVEDGGGEDEGEMVEYPFYTEGSTALLKARFEIAKESVVKAAVRLGRARRKRDDPDEDVDAEINWALDGAKSFALDCSEIGDVRPLAGCSFSCDGKFLATCSLTGVAKIWSMPGVNSVSSLKGHAERATDVKFSPTNDQVATASADRTAKLWNTEGTLLNTYTGHLDRLARVAFHPSGKYLGTTSFDKTWRLWDTETGDELLLQEGHSRSVYGLAFHPDGSLVASCGLDALARVWDLRSGRSILALEGHVKPVLGISFSPNGYHLATGGEDNTCRIWDLRKKRSLYTIPAHANLISDIKFEPQEGYFLVTASYDMTAKIWSSRDFKPVKVLSGHEAKVTSVDVAADGQSIATVSHDRTIKLWSSKNAEKDKAMDVD